MCYTFALRFCVLYNWVGITVYLCTNCVHYNQEAIQEHELDFNSLRGVTWIAQQICVNVSQLINIVFTVLRDMPISVHYLFYTEV